MSGELSRPGEPVWARSTKAVHFSTQPTSCMCGGDTAWVVTPGDSPGLIIMLGCVCHHTLAQVAAQAERYLFERGYLT